MKKTLLASLALLLGWGGTAFAQTETDALRYSQLGVFGTARIQGMGGAQTALGADISSLSGNPAGLGMFRRSEFTITPGVQSVENRSSISSERNTGSNSNFVLPQMGVVVSNRRGDSDDSDWRGTTFGIGFTRLNNFNSEFNYTNVASPPNTIVDYFADRANNRALSANETLLGSLDAEYSGGIQTLEGLAYGTYLIDVFEDDNGQYAEPLYTIGSSNQQEEVKRSGSQSQIDIGVGTSYKDRIYLGASLGIMTTDFRQESYFRESGRYIASFGETADEDIESDYNLALRDEFTTRGAGVNLKVGIIARPIDALRLGLSIQTPTAYTFNDEYQSSISATTLNLTTSRSETLNEATVPGEFNYRLTTPFRASGGVAYFISKYGFLTAEVEYVGYDNMSFSEDDDFSSSSDYFTNLNNRISNTFQSAVNYKIGAEGRYEIFRFRAGYAHSGDPYKSSELDGAIKAYTLGAGIRLKNFYLDLAYVNSEAQERYSPYTFSSGGGEPLVDIDRKQNTVALTLGVNF
ncbi:OmpP1/FadL family transporter [Pontibacter litorisediminis]|uniref:OmpP1/FadL family transporter n=1 Tax=Pontibacter litorisediminis TaxID=1846260 RepID=UPI0023ECFE5F|nr:hypothetical protein [Pontibacter litorisediminis]